MGNSIEIQMASGESVGYPGVNITAETAPVIVAALAGVTKLNEVPAAKQPTGRTPDHQWVGKDANNQDVTVFLWPEAPAPPVFLNPEDAG